MNKLHLLHEAEKLYCVENLTPEMIAEKLNISRRTVFNWKKKYKWDKHIVRIKDFSNLAEICNNDIKELFNEYKLKKLPPKTIRNNLSLLNQIIKYYQNLGIIDRKCVFQVRRLTNKNKFYMNRIIFEVLDKLKQTEPLYVNKNNHLM